jgi:hypothetical protein
MRARAGALAARAARQAPLGIKVAVLPKTLPKFGDIELCDLPGETEMVERITSVFVILFHHHRQGFDKTGHRRLHRPREARRHHPARRLVGLGKHRGGLGRVSRPHVRRRPLELPGCPKLDPRCRHRGNRGRPSSSQPFHGLPLPVPSAIDDGVQHGVDVGRRSGRGRFLLQLHTFLPGLAELRRHRHPAARPLPVRGEPKNLVPQLNQIHRTVPGDGDLLQVADVLLDPENLAPPAIQLDDAPCILRRGTHLPRRMGHVNLACPVRGDPLEIRDGSYGFRAQLGRPQRLAVRPETGHPTTVAPSRQHRQVSTRQHHPVEGRRRLHVQLAPRTIQHHASPWTKRRRHRIEMLDDEFLPHHPSHVDRPVGRHPHGSIALKTRLAHHRPGAIKSEEPSRLNLEGLVPTRRHEPEQARVPADGLGILDPLGIHHRSIPDEPPVPIELDEPILHADHHGLAAHEERVELRIRKHRAGRIRPAEEQEQREQDGPRKFSQAPILQRIISPLHGSIPPGVMQRPRRSYSAGRLLP